MKCISCVSFKGNKCLNEKSPFRFSKNQRALKSDHRGCGFGSALAVSEPVKAAPKAKNPKSGSKGI